MTYVMGNNETKHTEKMIHHLECLTKWNEQKTWAVKDYNQIRFYKEQ